LYYMMPPSCILIGVGFLFTESRDFPWELVLHSHFKWILLINGLLAFLLNVRLDNNVTIIIFNLIAL
jgi:hypothetical protein